MPSSEKLIKNYIFFKCLNGNEETYIERQAQLLSTLPVFVPVLRNLNLYPIGTLHAKM